MAYYFTTRMVALPGADAMPAVPKDLMPTGTGYVPDQDGYILARAEDISALITLGFYFAQIDMGSLGT